MQSLTITGRLIADSIMKSTQNGTQLCEFTVSVTTEYKKGADGYYPTQLYKIAIFGKMGEIQSPMLNKGVNVLVLGTPKYRVYEGKLYIDISANQVEILEKVERVEKAQSSDFVQPPEISLDDMEFDSMPF